MIYMEITFTPRHPGPFKFLFEEWSTLLSITVADMGIAVTYTRDGEAWTTGLDSLGENAWAKTDIYNGAVAARSKLLDIYLPYNYESR